MSAVRDSYGSIDAYLERAIGLTEEMRTELKARLLLKPDEWDQTAVSGKTDKYMFGELVENDWKRRLEWGNPLR